MCSEPPLTHPDCKEYHREWNYRGKINVTQSGLACMPWSLNTRLNTSHYRFPDASVDEALNYCRNPYNTSTVGPFCYTEAMVGNRGRWDFCGIPLCSASDEDNAIYIKTSPYAFTITTNRFYVAEMLIYVLLPTYTVFGTAGNSMSFIVFNNPSVQQFNTAFLLQCLAVTDTLTLWAQTLGSLLGKLTGKYRQSDATCKIMNYLQHIPTTVSSWVLVLLSLERVIILSLPFRAKLICTRKRAITLLSSVVVIIVLIFIPIIIVNRTKHRVIFNDTSNDDFRIFSYCVSTDIIVLINGVTRCFAPFAIIFFLNIVIIILFFKFLRNHPNITQNTTNSQNTEMLQIKLQSLLLLATSFIFLVLTF